MPEHQLANVIPIHGDGEAISEQKRIIKHREHRVNVSDQQTEAILETKRAGQQTARLLNISRFGCAISVDSESSVLEVNEEIENIRIGILGHVVFDGKAVVVNEAPTLGSIQRIGLLFVDDVIDIEKVQAVLNSTQGEASIGSVRTIISISKAVRPEFKALVADLNTLFQDLKVRLSIEEKKIGETAISPQHRGMLEEHIVSLALSLYQEDINSLFHEFGALVAGFDFDSNAVHKAYFRANFHPDVMGTPFLHRSYSKPLGHAGDYGLMVMLYEYENQGSSLFHKFFHRWSCNTPAALANKNRVEFLAEVILKEWLNAPERDKPFKLSSIACGPAREVENFLLRLPVDQNRSDIHVTCVDQEGKALDHALHRVRLAAQPHRRVKTSFLKEDAVLGIIKARPFVREIAGSQVVTCAGLFDYVSDRLSTKMIGAMYDLVAPGGVLLIGNVSDQNPDRFSMDYLVDWHLILRSPQDMQRLVPENIRSDKQAKIEVVSEALGLNLFLMIRKPNDGSNS